MSKILLTGGSGLIGSHIAERFAREGVAVRCLARPTANVEFLKSLGVEIVHGDVTDYSSCEKAMNGADSAIHTAALVSDWGDYNDFYRINVEGTLNILKAASTKKINKVIVTGSISTYGEENSYEIKNETSPYNSHYPYFLDSIFPSPLNYYRDTKAEMTRLAIEFAERHNINLTVIEPGWVYGEREFNSGFYEYIKTVKSGTPFMPGSKKNKFHSIYAGDLAELYFLAWSKGLKGTERFIGCSERADRHYDIIAAFCREAGLKQPRIAPKAALYPIAFALEALGQIFRVKKTPFLTRSRLNMFYDNIEYSSQKAWELLGFRASHSLEEGVRKTVRWYKENNLL